MPRPPVPPIVRRPLVGRQGPWRGVRDTMDPPSRDPTLAFRMRNVFPLTPEIGSGVVGRPGFRLAGERTGPTVQWIGQFEKSDGTDKTIKIAGGEIYEYDWLTDSWVLRVSQAEIAAADGALETAGRVWAVSFADVLVITDGVNQPITWDGTPGGGVAVLTNAPVMFGPPTVYYARLFAIKADERSTIVWCEPGQPNVGWEAEGYNNSWTLRQTDQAPLFALCGTNAGLYYFRARSVGMILGAVDEEFRTTGTHEAVSESVGCTSPDTVVIAEDSIWFLDSDGRPQRLRIGGELQEPAPWLDARELLRDENLNFLPRAEALYRPDLRQVLFLISTAGSAGASHILTFSAVTGQYLGFWDWAGMPSVMGMVRDPHTPVWRMMHATPDGTVYWHGTPNESVLDDDGAPIEHEFEGSSAWNGELPGSSTSLEFRFVRLDYSIRPETDVIRLAYRTPYGESAEFVAHTGMARWDVSLWDDENARWGGPGALTWHDTHLALGAFGLGRWLVPIVRHNVRAGRFFLGQIEAVAYAETPAVMAR